MSALKQLLGLEERPIAVGLTWSVYKTYIEQTNGLRNQVIPIRNIARVEKLNLARKTRIYMNDGKRYDIWGTNLADVLKGLV